MTPAKMFEGDLWVLASYAVQMAQNAYKNGQTDEREACAKLAQSTICDTHIPTGVKIYGTVAAKAIRARGQE
jgi:hypothetical protein